MILVFDSPVYLAMLFAIPFLVFLHFVLIKRRKKRSLKFANFEAISRVEGVDIVSKNIYILLISCAVVALLSFALAETKIVRTVPASSFSFVIAIDSSRSMEATDFTPNRFEAAKNSAVNFIDAVPLGTRTGVISFSGNAFIESDITENKLALRSAINSIPLSSIGGTDLAEAIITSTNLLRSEESKSIILISDGNINVGTIDDAINYANDNGVIIHTIAIGTVEGGLTAYGLSTLDEESLKALAYNTNGRFYNVLNNDYFSDAYDEILQLKTKKVPVPIKEYLIIGAVVLIIIEFVLYNSRYQMLP